MTPYEIIIKKRDGCELSPEEIRFFIKGFTSGRIPNYQMAALLMAIYFQGMTLEETVALTKAMIDTGETIDLSSIPGVKVDKHSTGGVGDKVSLVLAPLVAAAGVPVPMISGRGLGHTGGTLDKLESIPGFRTNLSIEEFKDQIARIGVAIIGQTTRLVPADKRIYALRDVTATVDSIPLVVASIMSKKLAEGIDALVLDVKTGRGAFFKTRDQALKLAQNLVTVGQRFGVKTVALLTSMEQPLGRAVGNWLETKEAIQALKGEGPEDLMEVVFALGATMLVLGEKAKTYTEGRRVLQKNLENGSGYQKFLEMVSAQGGDTRVIEDPESYQWEGHSISLKSRSSGFVHKVDALEIGLAAMTLGAGRRKIDDEVDYGAGILLRKKIGDPVEKGEVLAQAFSPRKDLLQESRKRITSAFQIKAERSEKVDLILTPA